MAAAAPDEASRAHYQGALDEIVDCVGLGDVGLKGVGLTAGIANRMGDFLAGIELKL